MFTTEAVSLLTTVGKHSGAEETSCLSDVPSLGKVLPLGLTVPVMFDTASFLPVVIPCKTQACISNADLLLILHANTQCV